MKQITIFINSLFLTFSLAAQVIKDPGTHPEAFWTDSELATQHSYVENVHAFNKVSLNQYGFTPDLNEFWEEGTWSSGYLPINNNISTPYSTWYNELSSNHPLIRETGRYGLGYIHAHHAFSGHPDAAEFEARANSAIDYLVSVQQPDGHFIFWVKRPGLNTPDTDESNGGGNGHEAYEQSYAVRLLAEGYWYKKCYLNQNPVEVYEALEKGADFLVDHIDDVYPSVGNSNIRGLYCWALAAAYKATGKTIYLQKAQVLADALYNTENTHQLGAWQSGEEHETEPIPSNGQFNDINLWLSGDFDGDGKDELLHKFENSNSIWLQNDNLKLGENNQYLSGTHTLEKWVVGNFDSDPADEVIHKFVGSPYIYLWNEGSSFGTNSIYTGSATLEKWLVGDFDNDGKDELLQKFSNSNTIYLMDGTYGIGTNAIYTAGATLENWIAGDFDNDGKDEVLQKYSGSTSIYQWNFGGAFGSGVIYNGPNHIEKWLVGDFDNDGYEEVLQKYANSTYIYLWDQGTNFGTNLVYAGGATLDKWIAGDFDGDNRVEVLQKYSNISKIYRWDYGGSFNGSTPYTGSQHTTEWIVSNKDGGTREELFQVFDSQDNTFYYWDNLNYCMGCYSIYNIKPYAYYHDTRLTYQGFILGGLIETYSISSGTKRANYATSIKRGVNHLIDRTATDPSINFMVSNIYFDIHNAPIPLYVREQNYFRTREGMQQMPQLAYYADGDATNFSSTDITRIINFGNRLAHIDVPAYTYYKDYMNAINNSEYLDYYGGCLEGVFYPTPPPGPIRETSLKTDQSQLSNATSEPSFTLFPNPTDNEVNIRGINLIEGSYELILFDNLGKRASSEHYKIKDQSVTISININHLNSGIYSLLMYNSVSGELVYTDKVIVQ